MVQKQLNYEQQYDIFLSYRRDGGETMALLLKDRLTAKGYRVFLDVESLNSGSFNTKLLLVIENCTDFVLVLSGGSLDRCVNEGDWVRQEIVHALLHKKNIVPIMLRGFEWPNTLPADIAELPTKNGVTANNNEYFDAAVDRLTAKFLLSRPSKTKKFKNNLMMVGLVALFVAILGVGFFVYTSLNQDNPSKKEPGNLQQQYVDSIVEGAYQNYNGEEVDLLNWWKKYNFEWWEGEWYGYWQVINADDREYKYLENTPRNCYGMIKVSKEGTATLHLWDDEAELAAVEMTIETAMLCAKQGSFFGSPVNTEWLISTSYTAPEDMIYTTDRFVDAEGKGFYYELYLRPWGMLWDDIQDGKGLINYQKPPNYTGWYVQNHSQKSMIDTLKNNMVDGNPAFILHEINE